MNEPVRLFAAHAAALREPQMPFWLMSEPQSGMWCAFPLKIVAEKQQVGMNTQLNRAVLDLVQFDKWDSVSIQTRQEMLAKLARKVWDMPQGKAFACAVEQSGEAGREAGE